MVCFESCSVAVAAVDVYVVDILSTLLYRKLLSFLMEEKRFSKSSLPFKEAELLLTLREMKLCSQTSLDVQGALESRKQLGKF